MTSRNTTVLFAAAAFLVAASFVLATFAVWSGHTAQERTNARFRLMQAHQNDALKTTLCLAEAKALKGKTSMRQLDEIVKFYTDVLAKIGQTPC